MPDELLPCPFCGPGQSQIELYFDDLPQRWRVGCGRCGASTGTDPRDKTKAPAIAAWNKRAPSQRVADMTRALEFARWVIQEGPWSGHDLDGAEVQERAAALGLIVKVPYDPEKHGNPLDFCEVEPGDDWYVFSAALASSDSK